MSTRSTVETAVSNHYARLGVSPSASAAELHQAFRRAAREAHPDRHGDESSDRMAEVNEAWHVLSDPRRRAAYDELLRLTTMIFDPDPAPTAAGWPPPGSPAPPLDSQPTVRRRSRWRLVLLIETAAVGAVIVGSMLHTSARSTPDGTLQSGDCVVLNADRPPAEVSCAGAHDAVVERLVAFGSACPSATVPYRDRAGRICMVPVPVPVPAPAP